MSKQYHPLANWPGQAHLLPGMTAAKMQNIYTAAGLGDDLANWTFPQVEQAAAAVASSCGISPALALLDQARRLRKQAQQAGDTVKAEKHEQVYLSLFALALANEMEDSLSN